MATFKLGAIVTDIAGSIGGTTLKRNGNYKVMMNKSGGSPYSKLLKNNALSYLGNIFKAWSLLDTATQEAWKAQALLYTFPDKFGNLRTLSGRQLFIKLCGQNFKVNREYVDVAGVNAVLPDAEWFQATFYYSTPEFRVRITNPNDASYTFLISIEMSLQPLREPTFISRKSVAIIRDVNSVNANIYNDIIALYPYYNQSYNARVYFQVINASGFKSVMQARDVIVV